jgi:hypothetical protein
MQDAAITHFALPVCTRTENHFLVGGLGVEDQQNSLNVIFLWGWAKGEVQQSKPRKWNGKKNRDTVPQLLFIS